MITLLGHDIEHEHTQGNGEQGEENGYRLMGEYPLDTFVVEAGQWCIEIEPASLADFSRKSMVLQASLPSLGQGEAEHYLVEHRKQDDTRNVNGAD